MPTKTERARAVEVRARAQGAAVDDGEARDEVLELDRAWAARTACWRTARARSRRPPRGSAGGRCARRPRSRRRRRGRGRAGSRAPCRAAGRRAPAGTGWLTSPQQTRSAASPSSTMTRSSGERPDGSPVLTTSAPLAARMPSPRASERAMSSAGGRLRCTAPLPASPSSASWVRTTSSAGGAVVIGAPSGRRPPRRPVRRTPTTVAECGLATPSPRVCGLEREGIPCAQ